MDLFNFVRESNFIEGITRAPTEQELAAHQEFLTQTRVSIGGLVRFVKIVQPDAILRSFEGMNVMVGRYRPPEGGPNVVSSLQNLLSSVRTGMEEHQIFMAHYLYENLHPFTDGNGRSGRALWLWLMGGNAPRLFLHEWYYQSLRTKISSFEPHPNLLPQKHMGKGFHLEA